MTKDKELIDIDPMTYKFIDEHMDTSKIIRSTNKDKNEIRYQRNNLRMTKSLLSAISGVSIEAITSIEQLKEVPDSDIKNKLLGALRYEFYTQANYKTNNR